MREAQEPRGTRHTTKSKVGWIAAKAQSCLQALGPGLCPSVSLCLALLCLQFPTADQPLHMQNTARNPPLSGPTKLKPFPSLHCNRRGPDRQVRWAEAPERMNQPRPLSLTVSPPVSSGWFWPVDQEGLQSHEADEQTMESLPLSVTVTGFVTAKTVAVSGSVP